VYDVYDQSDCYGVLATHREIEPGDSRRDSKASVQTSARISSFDAREADVLCARRIICLMRNRLREFFNSPYTLGGICGLPAVACATMALHRFIATYVFFAITGICLLLRVPFSDSAHSKYLQVQRRLHKLSQKPRSSHKVEALDRAKHAYHRAVALHCAFMLVATLAALAWTRYEEVDWNLSQPIGRLEPSNDDVQPICRNNPSPPPHSTLPSDVMAVYLGSNRYFVDDFPYGAIMDRKSPLLTLNRDKEGRISLTIDIRGKDGRIIARFDKGVFTVNQNNILHVSRPDASTLVLTDQYGETVLNARYRNKRVLEMTGVLYLQDIKEPMRITDDGIDWPTRNGASMKIQNYCTDYDGLFHPAMFVGNTADFE
jgi:hypothetical protein